MNHSKPVLIVGSGLSGLALAHGLKRKGIPFRIYERDAVSDQRAQGYRIRINQFGLDALRKCLPEDVYRRFEDTTAENLPMGGSRRDLISGDMIAGGMGKGPGAQRPGASGPSGATGQEQPPQHRGPQIFSLPADRRVMRSVLLSGLEDSVLYGKGFQNYTTSTNGIVAHFADGTSSPEGSLIVGADGLYSRVSRKLTDGLLLPHHLGSWMIFGKTFITPELLESLSSELTGGMKFMTEQGDTDSKAVLFTEPMRFRHADAPPDYVFWVVLADEDRLGATTEQLLSMSPRAAAEITTRVSKGWLPNVRLLLEQQDPDHAAVLRMTTSDPAGVPLWPTSARVTLIGDAVHCMPPVGGSGANTALRDAALLSERLGAGISPDGWSQGTIEEYEREMREYSSEIVSTSYRAAVSAFGAKPIGS